MYFPQVYSTLVAHVYFDPFVSSKMKIELQGCIPESTVNIPSAKP